MSISRRGNSWRVSLTHQGKQHRTTGKTQQEAEALELEGRAALLRGETPWEGRTSSNPTGGRLVSDLFDLSYGRRWAGSKGERTAVPNARAVLELLGLSLAVRELTQAGVNRVYDSLRSEDLAGATINRKMSCLQAMLTDAFEDGWIGRKLKVRRAEVAAKKRREISQEEFNDVCGRMHFECHRFLAEFLLYTGCRVGEALQVPCGEWQDEVTFGETKGGTSRTVPLLYASSYAVWKGQLDRISQSAFNHDWRQAREAAGLGPEVTPHALRHTCASRLVRAGVDLVTVQRWMGWSSPAMLNDYVHLMPDQTAQAVQALEAYSER